jgi:hypothetical protein
VRRTAYRIEGQTFNPQVMSTPLPEGFTVTAVEVDDPKQVEVPTEYGNTLTVEPDCYEPESRRQVSFTLTRPGSNILLSLDSARRVRNCLNAILGEETVPAEPDTASCTAGQCGREPKRRVFKDHEGDLWWELEEDRFYLGPTMRSAREDRSPWSLARLKNAYPNLTDVTTAYPEVNRGV